MRWVMIGTDTVIHLRLASSTNLATSPVGTTSVASSESGKVVVLVRPLVSVVRATVVLVVLATVAVVA